MLPGPCFLTPWRPHSLSGSLAPPAGFLAPWCPGPPLLASRLPGTRWLLWHPSGFLACCLPLLAAGSADSLGTLQASWLLVFLCWLPGTRWLPQHPAGFLATSLILCWLLTVIAILPMGMGERLEGLWEGEPQRPVLGVDSTSPFAPKGIVTGFISFCHSYTIN